MGGVAAGMAVTASVSCFDDDNDDDNAGSPQNLFAASARAQSPRELATSIARAAQFDRSALSDPDSLASRGAGRTRRGTARGNAHTRKPIGICVCIYILVSRHPLSYGIVVVVGGGGGGGGVVVASGVCSTTSENKEARVRADSFQRRQGFGLLQRRRRMHKRGQTQSSNSKRSAGLTQAAPSSPPPPVKGVVVAQRRRREQYSRVGNLVPASSPYYTQ